MKLHWTSRSPYVRKVMIFAHETGLAEEIKTIRSVVGRMTVNPDVVEDSPVGRIPALVLDDGMVLSGSFAICDYLDSLHQGRKLIPPHGESRWRELELHGVADGMLDVLQNWRYENLKPEVQRSQALCETGAAKIQHCLAWLDRRAGDFENEDYGIGQITTGVVLDYLNFRFPEIDWRESNPSLYEWHKIFSERPSSKATEFVDDELGQKPAQSS